RAEEVFRVVEAVLALEERGRLIRDRPVAEIGEIERREIDLSGRRELRHTHLLQTRRTNRGRRESAPARVRKSPTNQLQGALTRPQPPEDSVLSISLSVARSCLSPGPLCARPSPLYSPHPPTRSQITKRP